MSSFVNSGSPQLFKYLYPDEGWRHLVSAKRPFLAMVPKGDAASSSTNGGGAMGAGSGIIHVWNYSNPQGASMTHGAALGQQDKLVQGQQVLVQLSQVYKYLRFNAKDLAASKNQLASYMSQKKQNFDQVLNQIGLEIDLALHRAGNGILGTVTAVNANTITMSTTTSIQQYQVNMRIQNVLTAPTDGTAAVPGTGNANVLQVIQNYTGSGFSIQLVLDNAAGFAVGNYVVGDGNAIGFSSTLTEGNIIGMGNWVPTVNPAQNDNFLSAGINRSTDQYRLSGVRLAGAGRTYREAIQELDGIISSLGGAPDIVLMNTQDWVKANIELQGYARYETFTIGEMAFGALEIAGASGGKLRLIADPNQDVGTIRLLTLDTWKLWHMNDLIHVMMDDGLELRKDPGADAFQMGIRSWPQLVCFDPRANGVITF